MDDLANDEPGLVIVCGNDSTVVSLNKCNSRRLKVDAAASIARE